MSLFDKFKKYGSDALTAITEDPLKFGKGVLTTATSEPTEQLLKGLAGSALGVDIKQTNDNFDPEVVNAIRTATVRALEAGRKGTDYEDYDDLPDGTPMGEFVRSAEARKGANNFMEQLAASPAAQAAFSVGRGSIRVDDNGDVFFTDKYNFSSASSNKGKDVYSGGRSLVGRLLPEDEGDTTGNTIEIYLGKEEELVGRAVKKGDSLSKIAKEMGVSIAELAAFNNIANPNKIKVGQRIKKPPAPPEEEVSLDELLAGDEELFRGDIGA
jgi:LysM repeat protein